MEPPSHPRYAFLKSLTDRTPLEEDELYMLQSLATFPDNIAQKECIAAGISHPFSNPEHSLARTEYPGYTAAQLLAWAQSLRNLQTRITAIWAQTSQINAASRGPRP